MVTCVVRYVWTNNQTPSVYFFRSYEHWTLQHIYAPYRESLRLKAYCCLLQRESHIWRHSQYRVPWDRPPWQGTNVEFREEQRNPEVPRNASPNRMRPTYEVGRNSNHLHVNSVVPSLNPSLNGRLHVGTNQSARLSPSDVSLLRIIRREKIFLEKNPTKKVHY